MTALAPAAVRPRLESCRAAARTGLSTMRLLRLELRHNAMAWLAPIVIAAFWLTTYRRDQAMPPLWNLRAAGLQSGAVLDFVVPVTAAAAWMGSREARCRVTDQTTITARSRWARLFVSWAATTIWAMAAYLGCAAVLYAVTAHEASWGGPLWWPAAVAAATLPAFSALGFVVGSLLPSRFTAPLVGIAAFFIVALSTELIVGGQSYWQVSPIVTGPWDFAAQPGVAAFYPFVPDLSIAQVMFLTGFTVALLGVLAVAGPAGRLMRAVAAGLTVAGLLAAGTAVGLTGTGAMGPGGMIDIPALHDAASDQPIQYTPVCSDTDIPVCLNPAFAGYLADTANALAPLLSQLAGLPGAPRRIVQEAVTYQQGSGNSVSFQFGAPQASGTTSVFHLVLPDQLGGPAMTPAQLASEVAASYGPQLVTSVIGGGLGSSLAQNAVAEAVMLAVGQSCLSMYQSFASQDVPGPGPGRRPAVSSWRNVSQSPCPAPGTAAYLAAERVTTAARRFAALPASVRHAWLVRNLATLRAGRLTLAQLP